MAALYIHFAAFFNDFQALREFVEKPLNCVLKFRAFALLQFRNLQSVRSARQPLQFCEAFPFRLACIRHNAPPTHNRSNPRENRRLR